MQLQQNYGSDIDLRPVNVGRQSTFMSYQSGKLGTLDQVLQHILDVGGHYCERSESFGVVNSGVEIGLSFQSVKL